MNLNKAVGFLASASAVGALAVTRAKGPMSVTEDTINILNLDRREKAKPVVINSIARSKANGIVLYPHEALVTRCIEVPEMSFGASMLEFATNLSLAVQESQAQALAANQLGVCLRVICLGQESGDNLVAFNPKLELEGEIIYGEEGCLSMPGVFMQGVPRRETAVMTYKTALGEEKGCVLEGIDARAVQHEVDHLDGLMFFDKLPRNLRRQVLREWDKVQAKEWKSQSQRKP